MNTAILLLLASSVGVSFGWQPMSDGSPRVEYLVQIEPEMLATLQAGSTIPIVSEVPEDVGPIGRIRIVIGSETLPRQKLPEPLRTTLYKQDLFQEAIAAGERQAAAAQGTVTQSASDGNPQAATTSGVPGGPATYRQPTVPGSSVPGSSVPGSSAPYSQPPASTTGTYPGTRLDQPVPGATAMPASQATTSQSTGVAGQNSPRGQVAMPSQPGMASPQAGYSPTSTGLRANTGPSTNTGLRANAGPPANTGFRTNAGSPANTGLRTGTGNRSNTLSSGPSFPEARQNIQGAGTSSLTSVAPAAHPPVAIQSSAIPQAPAVSQVGPPNVYQAQAGSPPGMFFLLLAWVLLIGSVAGNIYLFWSYLDIRGKYQTMVHTNRIANHQFSNAG